MTHHGIVLVDYQGQAMTFNEDGWFNATEAAAKFGKPEPAQWLRLPETERYIDALCQFLNMGKSQIMKTKRGKNGGTWLHPQLAVPFARWCDISFSIWCDIQIDKILRGNHPHYDHKKARSEAASSFKVMSEAVRLVREAQAKQVKPHHFINEARLVNYALVGKASAVDRDTLSHSELDLLAKLEIRNTVLLGQGFDHNTRKAALVVFAAEQRRPALEAAA